MREIVLNREEIQETCKRIAKELEEKFKDNEMAPIFVGVLKGATPFFMDLLKYYLQPVEIDFIEVTSYDGTSSTGIIHLKKDLSTNIKNRDVVIIEDIVDTGLTLSYLKEYLRVKHRPKSITVVTLLDKKPLRKVEFDADIVGVTLNEPKFLVGYGLDYKELVRNYDYIFVPTKKDITAWDKLVSKENRLNK